MSAKGTTGTKRPRRRLPTGISVGAAVVASSNAERVASDVERSFRGESDRGILIGHVELKEYLRQTEMGWVLSLDEWLRKLDLSALTTVYSKYGPDPIHPRRMLGLILYGMLVRQWSLRELETLARRDLGAWFLCNGEQPDHSTIGDFITLHAKTLGSEDWFIALVRTMVQALGLRHGVAAIDGTVIESAASRARMLSLEAARAAAEKAASEASAAPNDARAQADAERANLAAQLAQERIERREDKGTAKEGARVVAPSDPEAVQQPRKDGAMRPAYKPSICVTPERIVAGFFVDPSNEIRAVAPLTNMYGAVFGQMPDTLLVDAGYFCATVLNLAIDKDINLLCASGQALGADDWEKDSQTKKFSKRLFVFQPDADVYRCPAGQTLTFLSAGTDRHGTPYRYYRGTQCQDCLKRPQCTDSASGRQITRYDGDDLKEAMHSVMRQPAAKDLYRQRPGIVEPGFAELRERQNLRRFHRRGLAGVRVEFALHCIAFNLKRAGRLQAGLRMLHIYIRLHDRIWCLLFTAFWFNPEVPSHH
jgi:transposase